MIQKSVERGHGDKHCPVCRVDSYDRRVRIGDKIAGQENKKQKAGVGPVDRRLPQSGNGIMRIGGGIWIRKNMTGSYRCRKK